MQLFLHGSPEESQQIAADGYQRFRRSSPEWSARFRLLEAQLMVWRGFYHDALKLLAAWSPQGNPPEDSVRKLALQGVAYAHLHQFEAADHALVEAEAACARVEYSTCGDVYRARGVYGVACGQLAQAARYFTQSLDFGRAHHDPWLAASAFLNLGVVALRQEHYDEALDWSRSAYQSAADLHGNDLEQAALGNLGWAYFELGDTKRALDNFLEAERQSVRVGNIDHSIGWLTTAGVAYQTLGDLPSAIDAYHRALNLALKIGDTEDIINALELLAHASIDAGRIDDASSYLRQLAPYLHGTPNPLDVLDVAIEQGRIAAARGQGQQAEALFRSVENDPAAQITMRLSAEHELARLYEAEGNVTSARNMYRTAIATFESERDQVKNEDSKLPFSSNATPIYDDYIQFLMRLGDTAQALAIADQSRAQTLLQGLGVTSRRKSFRPAALTPGAIASKTGATLLFYWLGEKQSWLWAVTPGKTAAFALPPQKEIAAEVSRYRDALLGPFDPIQFSPQAGTDLYRTLIAPASSLLAPGAKVIVLCDGPLSELNFETLIVPAPKPHYWIEDADIISAPSLQLLASTAPSPGTANKLLLIGDAVSPSPDYPNLPNAAAEMVEIQKHFATDDETVLSRMQATPDAYAAARPKQYAYIDFVAHGIASSTDPLDSAIILSRASSAADSFKLYARDIIGRPIDARLVTISACYGGGTRSYAGEGLVGLSWAFLRAGAHNVIGALWEVSDDSTPRLMNNLYAGLEEGLPPSVALRRAKLALLHSDTSFRRPFYWAPFQLYTGL